MEPEGIGVLLEKLRKEASAKEAQGQALARNTDGTEELKKSAPAKDTACPECGDPDSTEMAARGVEVNLFRVLATFSCLRCKAQHKVDFESIDKTEGIDVRCSCGAIAYIPPSVWCQTCGKGMSTGWQGKISAKR